MSKKHKPHFQKQSKKGAKPKANESFFKPVMRICPICKQKYQRMWFDTSPSPCAKCTFKHDRN